MELSFIINHLAEEREKYCDAVAPPIFQTSNFYFERVADLRERLNNEMGGYLYSRGLNPTADILRRKLAALDGAEDALVFNSGAAAIFCTVLALVKAGDHVICVENPYVWAQRLFADILPRFGVATTFVDGTHIQNFEEARTPHTRLVYLESPNSWDFALQDLKAVAEWCKRHNIISVADNSYCTPIYQKPIEMGIDLCLQSATKYLNGHSDVIAGVVAGKSQHIRKIFHLEYLTVGSGIQPFNAWLVLRGLRTLPLRLEALSRNTAQVIEFLQHHWAVERVLFPLDPSFPQYDLARRQMRGACGLFSIILKPASIEKIENLCESLQHFLMAVSWGGHESLVLPKAATIGREAFDIENPEHRMLRFYIGLEEPKFLIDDLARALESLSD